MASVAVDPLALAKFEFIRRVLDLPANDFYPDPADPINKPGGFLVDMAFATQARAEIEQRANGAVSQNRDHVYSLANDDLLGCGAGRRSGTVAGRHERCPDLRRRSVRRASMWSATLHILAI